MTICDTCRGEGTVFQQGGAGVWKTCNENFVDCPDCNGVGHFEDIKDIYINNHRLIHGDTLEEMDRLIFEGIRVDAVICDPTFGVTNRVNDIPLNFEILWGKLLKLRRNQNTPIILMASGLNYVDLVNSNRKMFKYEWIWNKVLPSGMLNAKNQPMNDFDDIAVFYEKQCVYNRQMTEGNPEHGRGNIEGKIFTGYESNYNSYKICTDDKGRTEKNPTRIITIQKDHPSIVIHSQQKPVALGEYLVKTYTNEGDTVLDFMMGSGFVIKACNNLNRKAIGIDNGKCEKEKFKDYFGKNWNEVLYKQLR